MSGSQEKRRRRFDVEVAKARTGTVKRFWSHVVKTDGCWCWSAARNPSGYGMVVMGRIHIMAHRFSYALAYGNFDPQMDVLHSCDNPPCVRPDHLKLGTHEQNMHDMVRRGRSMPKPWAKLDEHKVRKIRQQFKLHDPDHGVRALAIKFQVHPMTVYDIITFRTWREVL